MGKALQRKLADNAPDRIDNSDKVALTHMRTELTWDGDAGVTDAEHEVSQFWNGPGPLSEDAKEALSIIVREINDRFGEGISDEDRIAMEAYPAALAANEAVVEAALANDDFAAFRDIVLEPVFLKAALSQMDANEKIFKRLVEDDYMRRFFVDYVARRVFDEVRSQP